MRWLLLLIACSQEPTMVADLAQPDLLPRPIDKIDILFVLDDSASTSAFKNEIMARFSTLTNALGELPAKGAASSIHIGVITTDLGAGPTTAVSNCAPGGQGGKLQRLGRAHGPTCTAVTGGVSFIDIDQVAGTTNLPPGQDLATTFTCMAAVGDQGCGFEHVLEAAYRALHDDIPENAGFLREDSLLVVFWAVDEDDCSAPPDTHLFDVDAYQYGPLYSFRCTNFGIMCGDPPMLPPFGDSGGPLAMCQGATAAVGGKLFDVQRYVDFFTKPGGVKADPRDVILASVAAPPTPFATVLGNVNNLQPCDITGTNCTALLSASCHASSEFFGDPAVRLSQVVRSALQFVEATLCQPSYEPVMQALADAILQRRVAR